MSRILVIGNGIDPLDSKRGAFIDEHFDDVLIMKYAICFLDEYKEYIGTPTILSPPWQDWRRASYLDLLKGDDEYDAMSLAYDAEHSSTFRNRVYDCIGESNIHTILERTDPIKNIGLDELPNYLYPYEFPRLNKSKEDIHIHKYDSASAPSGWTVGAVCLKYAIDNYDEVCYMGLGGDKSYISEDGRVIRHFYGELEEFYWCVERTLKIPFIQSNILC